MVSYVVGGGCGSERIDSLMYMLVDVCDGTIKKCLTEKFYYTMIYRFTKFNKNGFDQEMKFFS